MNDTRSTETNDKSWIEKIALAFSSEPKTREDLSEIFDIALDSIKSTSNINITWSICI